MENEQGYWTFNKHTCKFFGVSSRRWTLHQRIYILFNQFNKQFQNNQVNIKQNVIYCRVSSSKQKDDLEMFLSC